ncbi:MAG: iron-containing alcohol dehydrogenase, partial [Comamonadaceae bacterium]
CRPGRSDRRWQRHGYRKGHRLMMALPGRIEDYFGIDRIERAGAPVIAIPTTAGTGSEVTVWSVLHDTDADRKVVIGSPYICPRIALLDPQLSRSLPPSITAATGMDALTHAIESYVNQLCHPFVDATAEQAISLIGQHLRTAVAQGNHLEARGKMLIASSLAGMAFNRVRLGLVHAFSLPLGNKYHIPHGLVNGIMLPAVMAFNVPGNLTKYARIAQLLGEPVDGLSLREAAQRSVRAVEQLKADIGLTQTLSDFGLTPEGFDDVIEEAMTSGNVAVNPRMPQHDDMRRMLQAAL